jgi:hypothetical protein
MGRQCDALVVGRAGINVDGVPQNDGVSYSELCDGAVVYTCRVEAKCRDAIVRL